MASDHSNLPRGHAVFLDHVGHFVADAAACAAALRDAGFVATPFSVQRTPDPATGRLELTGTGNVCVMLRSGYLEFLAHTADTPIGREFNAALARRAGLHLAAFAVADAEARHAELAAEGFPMRPLVRMSREVESPTGPLQARFTVARLARGTMPEGRIQVLTHGTEAAMWQQPWLEHPNGATGLASIMISAPDPAETASRFARFLRRPSMPSEAGGYRIALDRGSVEVLTEAAALDLVGMAVEPGQSSLVGYRVSVADLSATVAGLQRAGLPVRRTFGGAVIPFPPALGIGA